MAGEIRTHDEIVFRLLPSTAGAVADIGCGDGRLVRPLAAAGARAIGIDNSAAALGRARAAGPPDAYVQALAQALPLPDASQDAVILCNSLHHVPEADQAAALAEVARVLRPGGTLLVIEPLAEGAFFELTRPVEDETAVRAAAYRTLREAAAGGRLAWDCEDTFLQPLDFADFEELRRRSLAVEPAREAAFAAHEATLRRDFAARGERHGDRWRFLQPSRVNRLRRT